MTGSPRNFSTCRRSRSICLLQRLTTMRIFLARVAKPIEDFERALSAADGWDVERENQDDLVRLVERRQGYGIESVLRIENDVVVRLPQSLQHFEDMFRLNFVGGVGLFRRGQQRKIGGIRRDETFDQCVIKPASGFPPCRRTNTSDRHPETAAGRRPADSDQPAQFAQLVAAARLVAMKDVPQPPLLENTAIMRPFFFGASTCPAQNSATRSRTVFKFFGADWQLEKFTRARPQTLQQQIGVERYWRRRSDAVFGDFGRSSR